MPPRAEPRLQSPGTLKSAASPADRRRSSSELIEAAGAGRRGGREPEGENRIGDQQLSPTSATQLITIDAEQAASTAPVTPRIIEKLSSTTKPPVRGTIRRNGAAETASDIEQHTSPVSINKKAQINLSAASEP